MGDGDGPLFQLGHPLQKLGHGGVNVQAQPDQRSAGVGGVELVLGLLDNETLHGIHPPSEILTG